MTRSPTRGPPRRRYPPAEVASARPCSPAASTSSAARPTARSSSTRPTIRGPARIRQGPQRHHSDPWLPVLSRVPQCLDDIGAFLLFADGEPGVIGMDLIGGPAELQQPHALVGVAVLDHHLAQLLDTPKVEARVREVSQRAECRVHLRRLDIAMPAEHVELTLPTRVV